MAVKLITPPASEPITLAEAKAHLRVEIDDDDLLIGALITAAREAAEHETRRSLMPQTWELALTGFPSPAGAIRLPKPPVSSVTSVKYFDTSGEQQTMAETDYLLNQHTDGADLHPAYTINWPVARKQPDAVTIRYVAGYPNAASVPSQIKAWMLLRIGLLYENREAASGLTLSPLPFIDGMLDPYRVWGG
jgi:uncharacterized phiE125 gp8 family phage protein